MDDFDYMTNTLEDWNAQFGDELANGLGSVKFIQDEYVPRFEAAVYRNISRQLATLPNWTTL